MLEESRVLLPELERPRRAAVFSAGAVVDVLLAERQLGDARVVRAVLVLEHEMRGQALQVPDLFDAGEHESTGPARALPRQSRDQATRASARSHAVSRLPSGVRDSIPQ